MDPLITEDWQDSEIVLPFEGFSKTTYPNVMSDTFTVFIVYRQNAEVSHVLLAFSGVQTIAGDFEQGLLSEYNKHQCGRKWEY